MTALVATEKGEGAIDPRPRLESRASTCGEVTIGRISAELAAADGILLLDADRTLKLRRQP